MLRSYRCVIIAAVGWLSLIGAAPSSSVKTQPDQTASYQTAGQQLDRIAAALEKAPQSPKPDPGCNAGKDDRQSDLCAQWKAADAASESAWWGAATFYSTLIGLLIGAATLTAAGFAAWFAKRAADETMRGANAAEDALIKEFRPWLKLNIKTDWTEISDGRLTIAVIVDVINVGRSPAHDVTVSSARLPNDSVRDGWVIPPFGKYEQGIGSILPVDHVAAQVIFTLHFDEGWKDPNSTNDDAIRALRPAGVIRVDYAFGNEGRGESVAGVKFEAKRERDGPYYATFWSDMSGAIKGVHATGQYLSVK